VAMHPVQCAQGRASRSVCRVLTRLTFPEMDSVSRTSLVSLPHVATKVATCDSSCATCYPDNPKCMSCPQGSAMHHGKCISYCPEQHYLDVHGRCRACHSSCWSCSGPSVSQCTLCSQGLSLHQGQCLETCGEGLYHQDQTCHSPLSSDCLRCLKPEEALQPQNSHTGRATPHG
ncbi:unnamed protein product, partial [Coregonus sp. 'balchen']